MRTRMMLSVLSLAPVLALLGAGGCGETSYFEVAVSVSNTLSPADCLSKMNSCEVRVSGADSSSFSLGGNICVSPINYSLGKFQFTTEKDSGNMNFHVEIFDGNLRKLGQGDAAAAVKAGGIQTLMLTVMPDVAAFNCTAP